MKYEYTVIFDSQNPTAPARRQPLIEVELFGAKNSVKIENALIDSGADYCLFNLQYALHIGVELKTCKTVSFTGIGGLNNPVLAYMTTLELQPKHLNKIKILIGFVDSDSVNALLGQVGFFDEYRIRFERDHQTFEIIPVKR